MKKWSTEIYAMNESGELCLWAGPIISAPTFQEAQKYCQENELGYCKIIGELILEIPHIFKDHINTLFGDHNLN